VSNMQLGDVALENAEIQRHFPELGSADYLRDHENAIYIPPGKERDRNKSQRARMLPLDGELRRVLARYLQVRPTANGSPWLFLSDKSHSKIDHKRVNAVWKSELHPEYAETEEYQAVTSHFGRHRFSTFFRKERNWQEEDVQYMTGHKGSYDSDKHDSLSTYVHTYYEDIKDRYLDEIYKFGLGV